MRSGQAGGATQVPDIYTHRVEGHAGDAPKFLARQLLAHLSPALVAGLLDEAARLFIRRTSADLPRAVLQGLTRVEPLALEVAGGAVASTGAALARLALRIVDVLDAQALADGRAGVAGVAGAGGVHVLLVHGKRQLPSDKGLVACGG